MITENLKEVQENIAKAKKRCNVINQPVTLIAVSKTKPVSMIEEAYAAGIRDFGENKVQELVEKAAQLPEDIKWHLIGHLQTNKVKYIVDKVYMIHSVDSLHLAKEISKEAVKKGVVVKILIEVNIANEISKFGVSESECEQLVRDISVLPNIKICGLMTIAPFTEVPEKNRDYFRLLQQLSVDIKAKNIDNISMDVLSMGMSGDYQIAIEEGATYVRVGTNIFGNRLYGKGEL